MEVDAASIAAKFRNIRCLELALKYGHSGTDPDCLIAAAEGGSLPCVINLLQNCNATVTEHVVVASAMAGKFGCVEHIAPILENSANEFGSNRPEDKFGPPPFGEHARQWMPGVCDHMALQGNAAALLTLVQGKCGGHMDDKTLLAAVKGGSFKCVEYATTPTPPPPPPFCVESSHILFHRVVECSVLEFLCMCHVCCLGLKIGVVF
jgi:hypothetical protein